MMNKHQLRQSILFLVAAVAAEPIMSSSIKYAADISLTFMESRKDLSQEHQRQLSSLVNASRSRCARETPNLTVVAEAGIRASASDAERAIANERAEGVKAALLNLGVPAGSIYGGTTLVENLAIRRDAGAKIEVGPNIVIVEWVCNPE